MTLLSVVTVTYFRHELLLRKAASLQQQTLAPELFEWCVASNGDAEAAALLDELKVPFALKTVALTQNLAIPAARNAAAGLATGELLLMSDDDVLLPPGCLAAHAAAHAAGHAVGTDKVGVAAVDGSPGSAPSAARPRVVIGDLRLPSDLREAGNGSGAEREPFERTASVAGRALWINATGANTSLPRAAFEAVGGYDQAFVAYGGEDSELAWRLREHGAVFLRSAAAWAEHVGLVSGDKTKAYAAGRAAVRVWRKHPRPTVGLMLGVHPLLLRLKRRLLASPLRGLFGPRTADYEEAYLRGALAELAGVPDDLTQTAREGKR